MIGGCESGRWRGRRYRGDRGRCRIERHGGAIDSIVLLAHLDDQLGLGTSLGDLLQETERRARFEQSNRSSLQPVQQTLLNRG